MKLKSFLFDPDNDNTGGASPATAPAGISVETIPSVDAKAPSAPAPKAEPINAAKELGLTPRVQGPKEALGVESPKKAAEKMSKELRERHAKPTLPARARTGQFTKAVDTDHTTPKAEEPKPEVTAPEPPKPVAAETPKIKIGDKEMTADEIAAELKTLREKAEPKTELPPAAKVEEPEKKPEEIEAERKAKETEALAAISKGYAPTEEELDTILSGGKGAVELFAQKLASVELNTRKWMEETLNPILKDLYAGLTPITKREQEIAAYTAEANFLNSYPDIKAHEKGQIEAREVSQLLHNRYDRIQQLIAAGVATAEETKFVQEFESTTPEQFADDVAHHVRQRLGITGVAAPATQPVSGAAAPAVVETPAPAPAARPAPHTGQAPTGAGAPRTVSEQATHVASIRGF